MKPRENPFRVEKLHGLRFRFRGTDWNQFLTKLNARHFRGAIVGPHGSGKTTLMLELHERLSNDTCPTQYLRINSESSREAKKLINDWLATASTDQVLLLDGAEQIPYFAWRCFLRQTKFFRGLVITTHRTGRLPTLYETQTDLDLLTELVSELVPVINEEQAIETPTLSQLFAKHHGNLRECLRALYEQATR